LMFREALITASFILSQMKTMKVFSGPISPYTMHPVMISMLASTLSEIGKERFGLVIGTGDKSTLNYLGVEITKPLTTIKEAVKIIRALCRGEKIKSTGIWQLNNVKLLSPPDVEIPIYLTGIGPKMIALAKRIADGVMISAATSPEFIRYSLDSIKNNSISYTHFSKIGVILTSVNDDRNKALAQIKPLLAFMLRGSYLKLDWQLNELDIDGDAIREAIDIHNDLEAASNLISERAVDLLTASGTPDEFQERLQKYLDAGIDYPVLLPVGNKLEKLRAIELASKILQ
jgi:5,10-methylenetetrahydromethanopterin reductase